MKGAPPKNTGGIMSSLKGMFSKKSAAP